MDSSRVHTFAYPNITSHFSQKKIFRWTNGHTVSEIYSSATLAASCALVAVSGNTGCAQKWSYQPWVHFQMKNKLLILDLFTVTSSDGKMHSKWWSSIYHANTDNARKSCTAAREELVSKWSHWNRLTLNHCLPQGLLWGKK